tara:strand:+ start:493 stop:807 length:315 start_codon:yes stop_codon:yes gene_type:complete
MECSFCLINDDHTRAFSHKCGNYYVHDDCLNDWLQLQPNICFICREPYQEHLDSFKVYSIILFGPNHVLFRDFFNSSNPSLIKVISSILSFYFILLSFIYLNKS